MENIIKLLPDHVANQIAAGEVIQRPASVVKELMENAIDAGATSIKVKVKEAGKTYIQVQDNGKGMWPMDARVCWERHATSKLRNADDLYRINTKGFRGEALASIAAVAHVDMQTLPEGADIGTRIHIEGGQVIEQEPIALPNHGTGISVSHLFFNIPARRNFLKSNPVEMKHVMEEFLRIAIPHPEVGMELYHNDQTIFQLRAGLRQDRIADIFNYKDPSLLLSFTENTSVGEIQGWVGKPELSKKSRGEQYFFVNGRYIRENYFHHAVMGAYEGIIPVETYPSYYIFLRIPTERIDVNVHPAKTEVKFEDEKLLYQIIRSSVRNALGLFLPIEKPDFNADILRKSNTEVPVNPDQSKGWTSTNPFVQNQISRKSADWKKILDPFAGEFEVQSEPITKPLAFENPTVEKIKEEVLRCFQIEGKYILTSCSDGLFLAEQEGAHQRVLFERYLMALEGKPVHIQEKLFPRVMDVPVHQMDTWLTLLPDLKLLGFDLAEFGPGSIVINGVPAELSQKDEVKLLAEVMHLYQQSGQATEKEKLARAMAQKSAIQQGEILQEAEMKSIISALRTCVAPALSPFGKKIWKKLHTEDFEALLK